MPKGKPFWNDERDQELAHLIKQGLSYNEISERIGTEEHKPAIAPRVHRKRKEVGNPQWPHEKPPAGHEEPLQGFQWPEYGHIEQSDTFLFNTDTAGVLALTGDEWTTLINAYVRDGLGLSKYEVVDQFAGEVSIPLTEDILKELFKLPPKRVKKSHPNVPYEYIQNDVDQAADTAADVLLEADFSAKRRAKTNKALKRELRDYREREEKAGLIVSVFEEALSGIPTTTPEQYVYEDVHGIECDWVWPMYDIHMGAHIWGRESFGHDWDLDITEDVLDRATDWAISQMTEDRYWPDEVYIPIGGDLLHAILNKTENDTWLEKDTRDIKVLRTAVYKLKQMLERVAQVANRVIFDVRPGNHDHIFADIVRMWIADVYADHPVIEVKDQVMDFGHHIQGSVGWIIDHGDGLPKNLDTPRAHSKAQTVAESLFGTEYGRLKKIFYFNGHLHYESSAEHGKKLKLIREPALCPASHYATKIREDGTPRSNLYRLNSFGYPVDKTQFLAFPDNM